MPTPLHSSFPLDHFRAFPQLSSRKIPPLVVARLSSVLCLCFHQDIVLQLYLTQWYSPDNAYIILHRGFPCLFFFIRPSLDGTYYGMVMSVRPSGSPSVRHSFPHFSPTCFDILIWNFVYHFIFMHVRSSSNAINFRHFLQELCSFLTSNSYKYAVFRTFLLHALIYWVQILYMTLF